MKYYAVALKGWDCHFIAYAPNKRAAIRQILDIVNHMCLGDTPLKGAVAEVLPLDPIKTCLPNNQD